MDDKQAGLVGTIVEGLRHASPYLSTLMLSCFGGLASHIQRIRMTKRKFNLKELAFDLVISSFAGLMTYFFCVASEVEGAKQALLIAISGHMGTRAIAAFEVIRDRIFGVTTNGVNNDKQS